MLRVDLQRSLVPVKGTHIVLFDDYDYGKISESVFVQDSFLAVAHNQQYYLRTIYLHLQTSWNNKHREHKVHLVEDPAGHFEFKYV